MNRPSSNNHDPENHDQEIDVRESQVQGNVGQAGRNLYQATIPRNVEVSQSDRPSDLKQDRKYRKVLLNKVRNQWINGPLKSALKTQEIIDLNLEDREDILKPQPKMEQAIPGQQGQDLPTGTQIIDIFRKRGQGARMLILGQPGAGKSIALWLLARDLLDEAELNPEQPIPVIFLLSTWQGKQPIADWLVQELKEKYSVSESLGRNWVENERLLLLLDGLDEVRENLQEDCVEAINQFKDKYGSTKAVVCSRINDYDALYKRHILLKFDDAISLKPLEVEQVKQYLNAAGSKMAAVKAVIEARPELLEMVTNPLMLSVMTLAYQGVAAQDIPRDLSETDVFNQYVKQMLFRRKPAGYSQLRYKDDTTKYWLTWLAQRMLAASQTIFLIERLQPTWLSPTEKKVCLIGNILTGWIFIGIVFIGILWRLSEKDDLNIFASIVLTFFPLYVRIIVRYIGGWKWTKWNNEILTYESINLSWTKIRELIIVIFIPGFSFIKRNAKLITIIYILIIFVLLFKKDYNGILSITLGFPVLYSYVVNLPRILYLPVIVNSVLKGKNIENKIKPNQGIWMTGKNAIILGGINLIFFGFIMFILDIFLDRTPDKNVITWSILVLVLGVIGSFNNGGINCIRHIQLRLFLSIRHHAPWNYARFLDYATERLFLQKVGGGYIFVHRMLLEHFAGMNLKN